MANKKKNLKPDTALKAYWNRNEEFADLFNALLYGGKQVIKAEELEERDTESSVILQIEDDIDGIQAARDLFKVVMKSKNMEYILLGIENQEGIHYAMPLRDMEYCMYSYHRQYEKIKEKYPKRKGLSGNEFLSHMKKTDKFIPTITAVIYYGDEEWDGAKCLHEMMELPEELKPFVNDYKMNLIEAKNTELVFHNKNNQDLFKLLKLLYDRNNKNKRQEAIEYADTNKVDKSVILAIGSTSGINMKAMEEKGEIAMCTLFEEIKIEGREQGITEGRIQGITEGRTQEIIETGYDFNMSESEILERLQNKLNISMEKAKEYLNMYSK